MLDTNKILSRIDTAIAHSESNTMELNNIRKELMKEMKPSRKVRGVSKETLDQFGANFRARIMKKSLKAQGRT